MNDLGKLLILAGGALLIAGIALMLAPRIPFFGRLPGDIDVRWGGARIYIPLATSIILSILLTIILNLFLRR